MELVRYRFVVERFLLGVENKIRESFSSVVPRMVAAFSAYIVAVMMILTDDGGCGDDSDIWWL